MQPSWNVSLLLLKQPQTILHNKIFDNFQNEIKIASREEY